MINIKQLRKHYGNNYVLRGIDLTIKRGEVVVLLGSSGGGKSTLLRCINMIETPTSGEVWVDGIDMTNPATDLNKARTELGMVFQQFNLFPHMTVLENIMLAPMKVKHAVRAEAEKTARELLARVGLAEKADARSGWPSRQGSRIPESSLGWAKAAGSDCPRLGNAAKSLAL